MDEYEQPQVSTRLYHPSAMVPGFSRQSPFPPVFNLPDNTDFYHQPVFDHHLSSYNYIEDTNHDTLPHPRGGERYSNSQSRSQVEDDYQVPSEISHDMLAPLQHYQVSSRNLCYGPDPLNNGPDYASISHVGNRTATGHPRIALSKIYKPTAIRRPYDSLSNIYNTLESESLHYLSNINDPRNSGSMVHLSNIYNTPASRSLVPLSNIYNPPASLLIQPKAPKESRFNDETSNISHSKRKRSQVKSACSKHYLILANCRKSCKKCSHTRPCERCVKQGVELSCREATPRLKKFKAKSNGMVIINFEMK